MTEHSCPKLASKARLRFDRRAGRFLLLYPERGLILNPSASEILQLCDGRRTIRTIANLLARRHGAGLGPSIRDDVLALLSRLHARGLVQEQD